MPEPRTSAKEKVFCDVFFVLSFERVHVRTCVFCLYHNFCVFVLVFVFCVALTVHEYLTTTKRFFKKTICTGICLLCVFVPVFVFCVALMVHDYLTVSVKCLSKKKYVF